MSPVKYVYFITGDGMLHIVNAADGQDLEQPYIFLAGKGWALNLAGNILWIANTKARISVATVRLDDPSHKVMTFNSATGGDAGPPRHRGGLDRNGMVHDR